MMKLPAKVNQTMEALINNGFAVYAVGGCVRDALLDKEPLDWDLATNARLWNLEEIFPEAKIISDKYSVIRRDFPDGMNQPAGTNPNQTDKPSNLGNQDIWGTPQPVPHVDIATFRTEGGYSDSRRPDRVTFVDTIEEDLKRRDFTINAIAYGYDSLLVDLYCGQKDLEAKVIRCIGEPGVRFKENPIRMLRAVRMAAEYDFNPDSRAFQAMLHMGRLLSKAGPDRIRTDFLRLIVAPHASRGLKLLIDTNLLEAICGIPTETIGSEAHEDLKNLIQTIDQTPNGTEQRLGLFYRCFGRELGALAIESLHFDKKTRKRLEFILTEERC
jgi:tRNA nucleotidyltransferase (CCA-adding enzyme)